MHTNRIMGTYLRVCNRLGAGVYRFWLAAASAWLPFRHALDFLEPDPAHCS